MSIKYIFLALILTISCSKSSLDENGFFKKKEILLLPLPVNCNPYSLSVKYFNDERNEYLFWLNNFENSIVVFNLKTREVVNTLQFPREGPGKIYDIRGFTVFSLDSIYLSTDLPGILYRVDISSNLKEKIIFSTDNDMTNANNYSSINSKYQNDVYRINHELMAIPLMTPFLPPNVEKSAINNFPLFKILNTKELSFRNANLYTPEKFYDYGQTPLPFIKCSTFDEDKTYYTFESDENIYYTSDFLSYKTRKAASNFRMKKFIPMGNHGYQDQFEYYARIPFYGSIIYDKYRNLFYRVVKHPMNEEVKLDDYKEEYEYPSLFSIMVLDENLNVLHEELFDSGTLNMYIMFVGKKGLYISASSPRNPDYEEKNLIFDVYKYDQ